MYRLRLRARMMKIKLIIPIFSFFFLNHFLFIFPLPRVKENSKKYYVMAFIRLFINPEKEFKRKEEDSDITDVQSTVAELQCRKYCGDARN